MVIIKNPFCLALWELAIILLIGYVVRTQVLPAVFVAFLVLVPQVLFEFPNLLPPLPSLSFSSVSVVCVCVCVRSWCCCAKGARASGRLERSWISL